VTWDSLVIFCLRVISVKIKVQKIVLLRGCKVSGSRN
jgi:hypothetical protein